MKSAIPQYLKAQRETEYTAEDLDLMGRAAKTLVAAALILEHKPLATLADTIEVAKLLVLMTQVRK